MQDISGTNYGRALQRGLFETAAPVKVRRYKHQRLPNTRILPNEARAALRAGKVVRSTTTGVDIFSVEAATGRRYYHARNTPPGAPGPDFESTVSG